jgi:hypothetical protein
VRHGRARRVHSRRQRLLFLRRPDDVRPAPDLPRRGGGLHVHRRHELHDHREHVPGHGVVRHLPDRRERVPLHHGHDAVLQRRLLWRRRVGGLLHEPMQPGGDDVSVQCTRHVRHHPQLQRVSGADDWFDMHREHAELLGGKLRSDPVRLRVPDGLLLQWDELCRGQRQHLSDRGRDVHGLHPVSLEAQMHRFPKCLWMQLQHRVRWHHVLQQFRRLFRRLRCLHHLRQHPPQHLHLPEQDVGVCLCAGDPLLPRSLPARPYLYRRGALRVASSNHPGRRSRSVTKFRRFAGRARPLRPRARGETLERRCRPSIPQRECLRRLPPRRRQLRP